MTIVNDNANTDNSLFSFMENHPAKFYLTGSRYFGGATAESDHDYFISLSDWGSLPNNFKSNFVRERKNAYYSDPEIYEVFVCIKHKIHIQVVKNVTKKYQIQQALKQDEFYARFDKNNRKCLWNLAYTMYNLGAGTPD